MHSISLRREGEERGGKYLKRNPNIYIFCRGEKKKRKRNGGKYLENENIFVEKRNEEGKRGKFLEKKNVYLRRRRKRGKYLEKENVV